MDEIWQLKISLEGTKPPIWRRVLVKKSITFRKLHQIIQIAMGWQDAHLHTFNVNGTRIGIKDKEFDLMMGSETLNETRITLADIIISTGQRIEYTYDFGDNWVHKITVEKSLPIDNSVKYPVCIKGKMHCPFEDIGGLWGHYDFVEALTDKNHPRHDEIMQESMEWVHTFDPKHFDIEVVNKKLALLR